MENIATNRCPLCRTATAFEPGPRADLVKCTACRGLVKLQPDGTVRQWLNHQTAGRKRRSGKVWGKRSRKAVAL